MKSHSKHEGKHVDQVVFLCAWYRFCRVFSEYHHWIVLIVGNGFIRKSPEPQSESSDSSSSGEELEVRLYLS